MNQEVLTRKTSSPLRSDRVLRTAEERLVDTIREGMLLSASLLLVFLQLLKTSNDEGRVRKSSEHWRDSRTGDDSRKTKKSTITYKESPC